MYIEIYISYRRFPSPNEYALPYRLDASVLDDAFHAGGLLLLEDTLNRSVGMMFDNLKDELMKPYRETAEEKRKGKFGPLAPFLEMGPVGHDIIKKIALEDHEKGKGE